MAFFIHLAYTGVTASIVILDTLLTGSRMFGTGYTGFDRRDVCCDNCVCNNISRYDNINVHCIRFTSGREEELCALAR